MIASVEADVDGGVARLEAIEEIRVLKARYVPATRGLEARPPQ